MRRSLLVACFAVFALLATAGAQESNFRGFYVGINAGGAFGTAEARTTTVQGSFFSSTSPAAIAIAGRQNLHPLSFTGGFTAGYNWQSSGGFVFGLETDIGALRLNEPATTTAQYPCCGGDFFTVRQSARTDWLLTARPRVGFVRNNVLWYGTGGVAVTNLDYRANFSDTGDGALESGSIDEKKVGWVLGGGAEVAVPDTHWSFKGEYLYMNFGSSSVTSTNLTACCTVPFPDSIFTHSTNLKVNVVRFGANYRF